MKQKHNHKYLLLKSLLEVADEVMDFTTAFICAGYGASASKLEITREDIASRRYERKKRQDSDRLAKKSFYKLLYDLEKDDLIERKGVRNNRIIQLRPSGRDAAEYYEAINSNDINTKEVSKEPIIIVFDIPEKERGKRDWLRITLIRLGFKMIQKSVWIGSVKLPKEFLNELFKKKLSSRIEILSVTKTGTIKNIL